MFAYRAIYIIVLREFKRFFRQRGRFVVSLVRPLIWLFIVGSGFTKLIDVSAGAHYIQFILPGIVGMTLLFSSMFSTMSVVWDREFGFLREMLVSPVSRVTIVLGKLMSGTALAVFQGTILLFIAPVVGLDVGVVDFLIMILLMTLVAFSITSLGLLVASLLTSLEGFNVIMNFLVLPMFFLSGALYPIEALPASIRIFSFINPLSYGVDAFKHVLLPGQGRLSSELPLLLDIVFVGVFALVMTISTAFIFERRK
ncbi:MAG: ABC transporter permease [Thermodesulfobacteriota bacterium]|nr:MAG: ABC transporter permease [Thermodesulfobacteriota bacterium]